MISYIPLPAKKFYTTYEEVESWLAIAGLAGSYFIHPAFYMEFR